LAIQGGEPWRGRLVGGGEGPYGVPVAGTRRLYYRDPTLTRERAYREHRYLTSNRANNMNATLGPVVVGGRAVIEMSADELPEVILTGVKGGITPAALGSGAYQWDAQPGNGPLDSATYEYHDGAEQWRSYGIYINTITVEGTPDGENLATLEYFGLEKELFGSPANPVQRVPHIHEGWETQAFIDGFGAYGTTLIQHAVTMWRVAFNNNLGRKYFADNTLATGKITVGRVDVTGEIGLEASEAIAATEYANWDAATKRSVMLRFGNNEVISGSNKRHVDLTVHGAWSSSDPNQEGAGTRELRLGLTGVFEPTQGDVIHWRLVNSRATAWSAA
jgi:hypothetical protein